MDKEAVAEAIVRVLDAFSCPEIATAVHVGDATFALETTDGERYFVEVQDV